eukprot:COSAG02_NODE_59427_length_274_cov_0.811429_1_plen_65_part_01
MGRFGVLETVGQWNSGSESVEQPRTPPRLLLAPHLELILTKTIPCVVRREISLLLGEYLIGGDVA